MDNHFKMLKKEGNQVYGVSCSLLQVHFVVPFLAYAAQDSFFPTCAVLESRRAHGHTRSTDLRFA